ncbi:hypothetical protein AJ80_04694 [Polytolypa hystricis UAMH7299]|uniref:Uncharacterized protein n=1 Tax=Polytolypa hystricis (strain UAMH7299) TaxID=1447883 RepID=A0A2B7Y9J7_POLH7|nr:hypothetical protein AJ80_04694 [Polytolypa hystricis UAMH7299]
MRVKPWNSANPIYVHRRKKYQRQLEPEGHVTRAPFFRQESDVPAATSRSPSLLLSLPLEILLMIFRVALEDSFTANIIDAPFFRFLELERALEATRALRGACSHISNISRLVFFTSAAARDGILYQVQASHLPQLKKTFPFLKACILDLGDPTRLTDLDQTRAVLKSLDTGHGELDFITAVSLEGDPQKFSPGYLPALLEALCEEGCKVLGAVLPSWDREELLDFPLVDRKLVNYLIERVADLSYYHAQIYRQILGHLSHLRYVDVPGFMLPPLFSQSHVASAASIEPLRHFKVEYEEYGDPFVSILKSVKSIQITALPNPIYALFTRSRRSSNRYEARFSHWAFSIGQNIESELRARLKTSFGDLSVPQDACGALTGLAYRGLEATSWDKDEDMVKAWTKFKSPNMKEIHIVTALPIQFVLIDGRPTDPLNFSIENFSRTLTSLTIDTIPLSELRASSYHFCELLAENSFPHLKDLDVRLYSICASILKGLSGRPIGKGRAKQWTIRTYPRVCRGLPHISSNDQPNDFETLLDHGPSGFPQTLEEIVNTAEDHIKRENLSRLIILVEALKNFDLPFGQYRPPAFHGYGREVVVATNPACHSLRVSPWQDEMIVYRTDRFYDKEDLSAEWSQTFRGTQFLREDPNQAGSANGMHFFRYLRSMARTLVS